MKLGIPQSPEQFVIAEWDSAFPRIRNTGGACEDQSKGMLLIQTVLLRTKI